jgi:hypothetical protein
VRRWPTKDDNTIYFKNGSQINFRYINQRGKTSEDGSTTSNLLSATYDFIAIDQIEDPGITFKDFLDLIGRLRGNTAYRPAPGNEDPTLPLIGPQFMMVNCNPTHNWFYRQIVQPYTLWIQRGLRTENLMVHPKTLEPIISLHEGSTYTNKRNLSEDYIFSMEAAYKGQMRERYLLGKWAAFEGLVYPDYESDKHLVKYDDAMEYLEELNRKHVYVEAIEGYDFGLVAPSCYILGFKDNFGRIVLIDGYYKASFNVFDQPDAIKEIRSKYAGRLHFAERVNADPSIFRKQVVAGYKSTGTTIAKIFQDHGVHMRPSSNDISAGVAKVSAYFAGVDSLMSPFDATSEASGSPMLFATDTLDFFHNEVSNYFWKRNPQGQYVDEPHGKDDHAMDTTKYMLARLPNPSEIVVPRSVVTPSWMFWHEREIE